MERWFTRRLCRLIMDPNSLKTVAAAAGAGGDHTYIDDVFNSTSYHGNGADNRAITTGIDVAGEGGMVIIKKEIQVMLGY